MKENKVDFKSFMLKYGTIVILLMMCAILSIISPNFLKSRNILNILKQISIKDKAVYSWKPMPSTFINAFDALEPQVRRMLEITRANGCCPEIVLKDTGTCNNDPASYGRFTQLCRRLIEEYHG